MRARVAGFRSARRALCEFSNKFIVDKCLGVIGVVSLVFTKVHARRAREQRPALNTDNKMEFYVFTTPYAWSIMSP